MAMMKPILQLLLVCALPTVIHAQTNAGSPIGLDKAACERLQAVAITPAQIGEPVARVIIESAAWIETAPTHCRINGQLDPVDTSATARPIKFGVALPAAWNGRAIQLGGGGMNGTIPQLAGRGEQSELARGYATYGSDSGHAVNDTQWLLNDEAIRNIGYMQMKKTHDAALLLISKAYGQAPKFNYYVGNSQGGREGLTVAQRYPRDYDGVVATVPIVGFSSLMLGPSKIRIQEKTTANWIPASKGTAILAEFMRQCDKLDGLTDGVIHNYVDCRALFNTATSKTLQDSWAKLHCAGDNDPAPADTSNNACLTASQIKTLGYIFSDQAAAITLPNGRNNFGMWTPTTAVASQGPGFAPPGMPPMAPPGALLMSQRYQGQQGAAADAPVFTTLGTDGVTGLFMQNPAANPLDFDNKLHGKRQQQLAPWLDSTQSDLSAFAARGGKLIAIIGTDDTIAAPGEQLNYYQSVIDKMGRGQVDAFARLYVLPQTGHGLTGRSATINGDGASILPEEIPSQTDRLALLTQWVEQGKAPAAAVEVAGKSATRPMCSYPDYPYYHGGERALAASYTCTKPVHIP